MEMNYYILLVLIVNFMYVFYYLQCEHFWSLCSKIHSHCIFSALHSTQVSVVLDLRGLFFVSATAFSKNYSNPKPNEAQGTCHRKQVITSRVSVSFIFQSQVKHFSNVNETRISSINRQSTFGRHKEREWCAARVNRDNELSHI